MGCDIHMYVEYQDPDRPDYWQCFGGRINPGRNYRLFSRLAGVRGDESDAIVPPRGRAKDMGFYSRDDDTLYIVDKDTDSEGQCSFAKALSWVKSGSSQFVNRDKEIYDLEKLPSDEVDVEMDGGLVPSKEAYGNPVWVTHPDWHTHSWLSTTEYATALRSTFKPSEEPEYYALLAAMRQLEACGKKVRVVFWFDN